MQGSGPPTPSKSVPLGMGKRYLENPTGGDAKDSRNTGSVSLSLVRLAYSFISQRFVEHLL